MTSDAQVINRHTDPALHEISELLDRMAPAPMRTAVKRIDPDDIAELSATESSIVASAIRSRQAEFASGRAVLRSLLGDRVEIGRRPNGAPAMPTDWVGSLSHDASYAVGIVGPNTFARSVGVDMEPVTELSPQESDLIVRPDDVVPDPLVAFVAKESVYKAWSGLGGGMLEHHDVRIRVDAGRFHAVVLDQAEMNGALGVAGARCIALVVVPAT